MSSLLGIIVPEAGTNYVLNPSAEIIGNFAAHNSATVTRDTTYARFGDYCYLIVTGGTNRGINLTLSTLANAIHHVTFYVERDTTALTGNLEVSLDSGSNYNVASAVGDVAKSTNWARYQVSIPAAQANGSAALIIRCTANENFRIDGVQVEATSGYYTTYIDGDRGGAFTGAYRWSGLWHASTSSRSAQERGGGREYDMADQYSAIMTEEFSGFGLPPITLNFQPLALQPGALYQRHRDESRSTSIKLNLSGSSLANMFQLRKAVLNVVKPNLTRDDQPFWLSYKGANSLKKVYMRCRYNGGGEFVRGAGFVDEPVFSLISEDPYVYEDDRETATLDFTDSVSSAAYGLARINGRWRALGSGFSGAVRAIAVDKQRGRVYFAGAFATANGVTVNGVCYWDGTTMKPIPSSGTKGVSGGSAIVYSLAIAQNGDLYFGGDFQSANGATADGLARFNVSADTVTKFTNGTAGDIVYALAIDKNGLLYGGGTFLNWDGDANQDRLWSYNGSAFAALSTGANSFVTALAIGIDGTTLYVGGDFTSPQTRIMSWSGSAFSALGSGASGQVNAICVNRNGDITIGGNFSTTPTTSYIAQWNQTGWAALGSGVNAQVYSIVQLDDRTFLVGGLFTTAGGASISDRMALWNSSTWLQVDADLPGSPSVYAVALLSDVDWFVGFDTTGTATAAGSTTVTNNGSQEVYPEVTVIGPSSSSCTLQWIENQSTGERWYLNLTVYSGETIHLDAATEKVVSDWRGRIYGQPLAGSDTLRLLPGSNTIACFMTGTTTSAAVLLHWNKTHLSVDGVS